jgi:hypothetical protein
MYLAEGAIDHLDFNRGTWWPMWWLPDASRLIPRIRLQRRGMLFRGRILRITLPNGFRGHICASWDELAPMSARSLAYMGCFGSLASEEKIDDNFVQEVSRCLC